MHVHVCLSVSSTHYNLKRHRTGFCQIVTTLEGGSNGAILPKPVKIHRTDNLKHWLSISPPSIPMLFIQSPTAWGSREMPLSPAGRVWAELSQPPMGRGENCSSERKYEVGSITQLSLWTAAGFSRHMPQTWRGRCGQGQVHRNICSVIPWDIGVHTTWNQGPTKIRDEEKKRKPKDKRKSLLHY